MAKQGTTGTTGTKKDGTVRKSTKGIPRVTDKVRAMNDADRAAWLDTVPAAHRAEVEARLTAALKSPPKAKKVDFTHLFDGRSVEELTAAQTALTTALAAAAETAEKQAEADLAAVKARLDALKTAREKVGKAAATVAA